MSADIDARIGGRRPAVRVPEHAATATVLPGQRRRRGRRRNYRRPSSGMLPLFGRSATVADCAATAKGEPPAYRMSRPARAAMVAVIVVAVVVVAVNRLSVDAVGTSSITVVSGDSLWSIAERAVPNGDIGAVVSQIGELNGLTSDIVRPGQMLLVPVP